MTWHEQQQQEQQQQQGSLTNSGDKKKNKRICEGGCPILQPPAVDSQPRMAHDSHWLYLTWLSLLLDSKQARMDDWTNALFASMTTI